MAAKITNYKCPACTGPIHFDSKLGKLKCDYCGSEYTAQEMREMKEAGETAIEVHGGGMGCALIKTDVYRKLPYPWYDWVNYGDANRGMLSEDLYFCALCHISHIPVYADVRVGCGHLLRHVQWPE